MQGRKQSHLTAATWQQDICCGRNVHLARVFEISAMDADDKCINEKGANEASSEDDGKHR